MSCTVCRTFSGPVCGACRAAQRILALLQSGGVSPAEERRVTSLLRGVAGELSDLVEIGQAAGGSPAVVRETPEGETKDLPPGSVEKSLGKAKSEYSYTEEDEEEEEQEADNQDKVVVPPEDKKESKGSKVEQEGQEDSPEGGEAPEEEGSVPDHRNGVILQAARRPEGFDPHYLTKALQLRNCGLGAAKADREKKEEHLNRGRRRDEDQPLRRAPRISGADTRAEDHNGGRGEGAGTRRRRGREDPPSPERPPIVRRRRDPKEERKRRGKKKKNNKGVKRRERGRQFKGWQTSRARPRNSHW